MDNIIKAVKTAYEAGECDEQTYLETIEMFKNKEAFTFQNGITMYVSEDKVDDPLALSAADMINTHPQ
tara:strand:- start:680 stop:883 length:204 start_codon:yes stop_codon:yes gene_type:complete